jgi:hypothetical protein
MMDEALKAQILAMLSDMEDHAYYVARDGYLFRRIKDVAEMVEGA